MEIITITNQKGGIAKSTTASTLSAGLSLKGYKVLMIDLDAQRNLTLISGGTINEQANIYNALLKQIDIKDTIQHLKENLDIIPASELLSACDMALNQTGKEYRLKEILEPIKNNYDYIIIDTPPALGTITTNALTCSNSVIIPAQADILSLEAIKQLYKTIEAIRQYTNPNLKIDGILLTRYNARNVLTRDFTDAIREIASQLKTKVYKYMIREAIAMREAQTMKTSIFEYAPTSNVANDYMLFINQFLESR